MSRVYEVNQNADIGDFARILVVDAVGTPTPALAVTFILHDQLGAVVTSGAAVEPSAATAPGWYAPPPLILPASGTYTIQWTLPPTYTTDSPSAVILVPDNSPVRHEFRDTAIIGETYRFNVLFGDRDNAPIVVTAPSIEIYRYDTTTGDRTTVVAAATPLSPVVPPSTGRYFYQHLVDAAREEGDKLYAEIQGADPTPGGLGLVRIDYILDLQARRVPGLGTSFVE